MLPCYFSRHHHPTRILSLTARHVRLYSVQKQKDPNTAIVEMLRRHKDQEEAVSNPNSFKINAFIRAINVISQLKQPIHSGDDQILELKGIGLGILNRINEYFVESDLVTARNSKDQEEALKRRAVLELQRVPGIGRVKAKALVEAGCTGVASLASSEEYHSLLSPLQIIGLKYESHLDQPVTREQAELVLTICKENLSSKYELILVGDYRRDSPSLPNITLMMLHPDFVHVPMPTSPPLFPDLDSPGTPSQTKKHLIKKPERSGLTAAARKSSPLHNEVVPLLHARGLLADTLSASVRMWSGVVRIPGSQGEQSNSVFRRMTIYLIPQKSRATALLALTGDNELNRHTRLKAAKMGMLLDEYGLWNWRQHTSTDQNDRPQNQLEPSEHDSSADISLPKRARSPEEDGGDETCSGNGNGGHWSLVRTRTEQDIFEALGMHFVEPAKRNFEFLSGVAKLKPQRKRFSTSFVGP